MSEATAGKMHDMTVGSPVKLILRFMVPMFLGNVFQQFYNVADSIIAGQFLGVRALSLCGYVSISVAGFRRFNDGRTWPGQCADSAPYELFR